MSKYIFIASDFEIPEVDLTNEQIITPIEAKLKGIKPPNFCSWDELDPNSEISYFESEDDMGNLCIHKENYIFDDVYFMMIIIKQGLCCFIFNNHLCSSS